MRHVRDLIGEYEDGDHVAIGKPEAGEQVYTYEQLESTAMSVANILKDNGVDENSLVAVANTEDSETVVSMLAAMAIGATVRFSGPAKAPVDGLLGPTDVISKYKVPDDCVKIGFGSSPDAEDVVHFGKAAWKADDTPPDAPVLPATDAITNGRETYTHGELIEAGEKVMEMRDLEPEKVVVVRAPLTDPRTVAGALISTLIADATIRFPVDMRSNGDLGVTDSDAPENRLLLLLDVPLGEE